MDILKNIAWVFNGISYDKISDFNKAVAQHQADTGNREHWQPTDIVLDKPRVQIAYEYYITPDEMRFPDETYLDEDEADILPDDPEEENERREVAVTFAADNGQHFTAGELLYKLHERLWHRQLGDHIYFEGLLFCNKQQQQHTPLFYLHCGS